MKTRFLILMLLPVLSVAQQGSEIYLFDIQMANGKPSVSNAQNITLHKGYDNQPSFHPKQSVIYYSSFNDNGRSDIKSYNYSNKKTILLTHTSEREYSPTVTPDEKFISCIIQRDNGAQDLGKYPINGGKPIVLESVQKIGYHVWVDKNSLLVFVLGDSGRNSLHLIHLDGREGNLIVNNPGRALHRIPGTDYFSFVHKESRDSWKIKRYDAKTGEITDIALTPAGKEDICWFNNHLLLSSDGNQLLYMDVNGDKTWQPVATDKILAEVKGITRLAINNSSNKLAVVVAE